jgi:hypothetical protein
MFCYTFLLATMLLLTFSNGITVWNTLPLVFKDSVESLNYHDQDLTQTGPISIKLISTTVFPQMLPKGNIVHKKEIPRKLGKHYALCFFSALPCWPKRTGVYYVPRKN